MPKLVVTENLKDSGLLASGGGLDTMDTGLTTGIITAPHQIPKYNIELKRSRIMEDEELSYEIAKIKVTPTGDASNFSSEVASDFSSGTKTNHFFKMPQMVDIAGTETESYSESREQASYSFETIFNYISEDYDNLQATVTESNLYAAIDSISMDTFLNILTGS